MDQLVDPINSLFSQIHAIQSTLYAVGALSVIQLVLLAYLVGKRKP